MNLIASSPTWLTGVLLAAIIAAAVEDVVRLRISNLTCLVVLVTALVAMALQGFPLALWQNLLVFVAILALGTPLFAAGLMGGGDIKLLASLGLWVNLMAAVWLLASTLLVCGVLAIGFMAVRLLRGPDEQGSRSGRKNMPYGIAITAGACLVFASQLGS